MKYWLMASYKINEIKKVENNLLNQKFIAKKQQEYDKLTSYINE
ncbi:hypothetical protein N8209_06525 [Gammaproteobacteria bacterium]|nr:hypothetical protein [Gammaproteobacteria bacterium]